MTTCTCCANMSESESLDEKVPPRRACITSPTRKSRWNKLCIVPLQIQILQATCGVIYRPDVVSFIDKQTLLRAEDRRNAPQQSRLCQIATQIIR